MPRAPKVIDSLPRKRVLAVIAGVTLAAIVAALTINNFRLVESRGRALAWERQTFVVLIEAERMNAALRGVESAARGYLITAEPVFRTEYTRTLADVDAGIVRLRRLTADSPRQRANVDRLERAAAERVALIRRQFDLDATGRRFGEGPIEGRVAMGEVMAIVDAIRREEQRLLELRRAEADRVDAAAERATAALSIAGALLLGLLAAAAAAALASANRARLTEQRARVEAGLRSELEERVAERTRDLKAANLRLVQEARGREAAEANVRQMQKMESVGQLTGGIAHDFNNMLAIIIGSLDMARRKFTDDPERTLRYLDNAEEGARRAAQLTARLLAFSRRQPLAPEAVDPNKLVAGVSELLRRTLTEDVRIETVLAGGLWRAFIDPGQLENAIVNLAVNARDAMPGGGKLTIETANTHLDDAYAAEHAEVAAGQYVVICVTDTGEGMSAEVIERAFDPFYTTKAPGKGTGLGLSQVYGFVKQSGGHVKIYSEGGVGTTVKLYVPRAFGPEGAPAAVASVGGTPRGGAGEIVMVVEDEGRVRNLSVDTLRELGYTVVSAGNGVEALELLAQQPRVDLLFTDVVMPEMNGRQLADRARALRPELKVLFTTGYTRNAIVHNGMVDPDVAFLPKPFSIDQLARRVRAVLDGERGR